MQESNRYPGYFHVPGFSRYVLSRSGEMINVVTGHVISSRRNNSGYYIFPRLMNDHGVKRQLSRARALCTTFKPTDMANFLQVDHVNCIHDDDRLENLEWVTPKENCRRAAANGLYRGSHAVRVRNYATKEELVFPSMAAAAKAYGLTKDAMQYRLEMNDDRVYPEGNQYKFVDDVSNWVDIEDNEFDMSRFGTRKRVLVRDIKDGSITEFDKLHDAAKFLDCSDGCLSEYLNDGKQRVLKGFFQAKFQFDKSPWRDVADPFGEYVTDKPKSAVVVTHAATGRKFLYLSQVGCARDRHLLTTTLNYRLNSGSKDTVYSDGFKYCYYTDLEKGSTTSDISRRLMSLTYAEMPFTHPIEIG